jgi:hypothetical protein
MNLSNIAKPSPVADCVKIRNYLKALKNPKGSSGIQVFCSSEYSEYSENGQKFKKCE